MPGDDAVPTVRRPVVILNPLGLHLRPAGQFVGLARRFAAEIRVHRDGLCVDGKSILDFAMLAAGCGTHLELEARGPDAEAALAALADLVAARFHEGDESERGNLAADSLGDIEAAIGRSPSPALLGDDAPWPRTSTSDTSGGDSLGGRVRWASGRAV